MRLFNAPQFQADFDLRRAFNLPPIVPSQPPSSPAHFPPTDTSTSPQQGTPSRDQSSAVQAISGLGSSSHQKNTTSSNPLADTQSDPSRNASKFTRFPDPILSETSNYSATAASAEAQPEPSRNSCSMNPCKNCGLDPTSFSLKWPQGDAHPLKIAHYTLIFQAVIGFFVFILALVALCSMGWWTGLETAAALAIVAGGSTAFFVLPVQLIIGYVKPSDSMLTKRLKTSTGTILGLLLMGLYGAAGGKMVKKPGKNFRKAFDRPPTGVWWTATVFIYAQLLLSGYCVYKILKFFFKPNAGRGQTIDSDLEDYPTENATSRDRATPILKRHSAEAGGSQVDNDTSNLLQSDLPSGSRTSPREGEQEPSEDVADPSGQHRLSAKARGKQKETRSDGVDELDQGLAGVDDDGKSWTPIK